MVRSEIVVLAVVALALGAVALLVATVNGTFATLIVVVTVVVVAMAGVVKLRNQATTGAHPRERRG
jgi:hypothetical protein